VLRVTLELEREPVFNSERIDGPPRVFIDMQNTRAAEPLKDASLPFQDDVVRQVRVGRQLNGRTRVVLDLSGAGKYSVYALYNPFRIVVDFERSAAVPPQTLQAVVPPPVPVNETSKPALAPKPPEAAPGRRETKGPHESEPVVGSPAPQSQNVPAKPATGARPAAETTSPPAGAAVAPVPPAAATGAPAPPSANSTGSLSLSRQLGLGISRVVIDAGHGGHDPGAQVKGLTEADLTLDIALRLEKLLAKQPGVDVVLTRRSDAYVPLEERTEIANRAGADLFLSIHANASEAASARGIETYFLNFAPNSEAEAVAARENAGSARTMGNLPEIVKAIALNNKIDESRDFATMVQTSMYDKLRKSNTDLRNLGVKQAPFMVLIGATMPSILAEISFITNKQEGSLLKTEKYRQQIAEALYQGIVRYQQSLKKVPALALNTSTR
jgi:N-acetylmuramoyl-L-alanine amidase